MKPFCCFLAVSLCILSCKKGKTLDHPVAVPFITEDTSGVYPDNDFLIYPDNYPFDTTVSTMAPDYAHSIPANEIALRFNSKLSSFLNKNNIMLQKDATDYILRIQSMKLTESLKSESYIDSCYSGYPTRKVYYSSLTFKVTATLYKNGIEIDSWTKEGNSCEHLRTKTDQCNEPKIFPIIRGTSWLVDQGCKRTAR